MFGCGEASAALYHKFGATLSSVFDIQVTLKDII